MNSYTSKKIPLYNRGRYLFMFDPQNGELTAIYDSHDSIIYETKNSHFVEVFGLAVETLDIDGLTELKKKLEKQKKYVLAIDKIIESRKM